MEAEEQRERIIQNIVHFLRINPFKFEFRVKKNPSGIKIFYEVTQEQMDEIINQVKKNTQ